MDPRIDGLSGDQQRALQQIRDLTNGGDDDVALSVLQSVGWDVQRAADVIFSAGPIPASPSPSPSPSTSASTSYPPPSTSASRAGNSDNSDRGNIETFELDDSEQDLACPPAPAPLAPRRPLPRPREHPALRPRRPQDPRPAALAVQPVYEFLAAGGKMDTGYEGRKGLKTEPEQGRGRVGARVGGGDGGDFDQPVYETSDLWEWGEYYYSGGGRGRGGPVHPDVAHEQRRGAECFVRRSARCQVNQFKE
ncbi:hypothetical protein CCMSSC00406_0007928 [Pleurotus cornucopiae]|uniref:Uncharacterized protein n=1 Tax=Pleurotus cornucopiae TaxID=5321 RepID=A0ACB7IR24_PLECO|nr:hypothetical protein CCMSSC00406_0007928 [Pleurotus cornucopiae]